MINTKTAFNVLSVLLILGGLLMGGSDKFPVISLLMIIAGIITAGLVYQGDLG